MNSIILDTAVHALRKQVGFLSLFVLAFTLFVTSETNAQTADTLTCNGTISINIGNVLVGDTVEDSISIINELGNDTSWTANNTSSLLFLANTTSGNINIGSTWKTLITCNPDDTGPLSSQINIHLDSGSNCHPVISLSANGIGQTKDSSTFSLQATTNVVAFKTTNPSDTLLFYIENNNDSTDIFIDSIGITQSTAFTIASPPSWPTIIGPGFSIALEVAYQRTTSGSDNGALFVITKPDEPILQDVALQGVRTGNDVVQTQPLGTIYFYLYPNPSNGPVAIHTQNITQAHVTITDVLGRTLTETSFTGDWQWDHADGNGIAPSGTYFVVVTGIGSNGESVHEVQRVVLE